MKKCREMVGLFKQSNHMNEILLAAQVSLNRDKVPLQLIQDVVTRWWSTQSMLERLIKLQDPVKFALSGHRMNDLLTDSDWAGIKMVEEFLRPFAKIQKFLEGEKYITVSFVPVLVQTMRTAITNLCSTEYKELADKMLTYFESRFGDGSEDTVFNLEILRGERRIRVGLRPGIYIAAACDPRTKTLNCIPSKDKRRVFIELTKQVAAEIEKTQEASQSVGIATQEAVPTSQFSEDIFTDFYEANNISPSIDEDFAGAGTPLTPQQIAEFEIAQYRSLPTLTHNQMSTANPLEWWKSNAGQFPNLSKIARRVLCVPATSASSERIFSAAGTLLTAKRSKLNGHTAAAMVFLHGSWDKLEKMEQKRSSSGLKKRLRIED